MQEDPRTLKQNDSLHKYFEMLAETLNNAGFDVKAVWKPEVEIWWNKILVKELLWRPVQELFLKKKSTKKLTRGELNEVYKILDTHLAKKFGILVDFPSLESWMKQNEGDETQITKTK